MLHTYPFSCVRPRETAGTRFIRARGVGSDMIDWGLAIKTACGGFGLVFGILVLLWGSVEVTRVITDKIAGDKK